MTKILAIDRKTNGLLGELNNRGDKLFYDDEHVQEMEGEHSFSFTMPATIEEVNAFPNRGRFLIPSALKGFHEFIILEADTIDNERTIKGTAAYIELDTAHLLQPGKYTGTLQELASQALAPTKYRLGVFQDLRTRTITLDELTGAYQFMLKLSSAFEIELNFRVETTGARFIGRFVDFIKHIGSEVPKEVVYGKDLIGVEMKEYADRITTRLIGIGPEKEDGTHLTAIVEDADAFQRWNDQGQHVTRVYTPDTSDQTMTQERLEELTAMELKKRIDSVVEYTVTAASIESAYPDEVVGLGYSLFIKNPEFKPILYAKARVIGVTRSITDKRIKTYTIGEVLRYEEEDIFRTFRQLQRNYGVKLIESGVPPEGVHKTIWINTSPNEDPTAVNVPHTYNFETGTWAKFSPTNAEEIGGLLIGKQYNGVTITPEDGITVDRTDSRVKTIVNATDGISIQTRQTDVGPFQKVFYVDENGNLTYAGILQGSTIYLGGENNENGLLVLYDSTGEPVGQLDGDQRGFDKLFVGDLQAPNVVSYGDFTGDPLNIHVASEPVSGNVPDDNNESPYSWAAPLRTIGEALRRIPKYFRGDVNIFLAYGNEFNESITINGFMGGGTLTITNGSGHNPITGNISVIRNLIGITLERIRLNCTSSYGAIQVAQSAVSIDNCYINGSSGGTDFGVVSLDGSSVQVTDSQINNVLIAGRASYGGVLTAINCTGSVSGYAWQAYDGGLATGYGTAPTGATGNTLNLRGVITGSWDFPSPPTPPAPTPVTQTKTWTAGTQSGTWRQDYNGWDSEYGNHYAGKIGQGSWGGYGPFIGLWFFPSDLPTTLNGKTIKQIRIFIARTSGGVNASQTAVIRPHSYSGRPGGKPSLSSSSMNSGIAVGQGKWITLPSSWFSGFENGTHKGFGINGGNYMLFTLPAKIEVTYV